MSWVFVWGGMAGVSGGTDVAQNHAKMVAGARAMIAVRAADKASRDATASIAKESTALAVLRAATKEAADASTADSQRVWSAAVEKACAAARAAEIEREAACAACDVATKEGIASLASFDVFNPSPEECCAVVSLPLETVAPAADAPCAVAEDCGRASHLWEWDINEGGLDERDALYWAEYHAPARVVEN